MLGLTNINSYNYDVSADEYFSTRSLYKETSSIWRAPGNILNGTGDFTISFWLKYKSSDTSSTLGNIFAAAPIPLNFQTSLYLNVLDTKIQLRFFFSAASGGTTLVAESNAYPSITNNSLDEWHHYLISFDRDVTTRFYLDGVAIGNTNSAVNSIDLGPSDWGGTGFYFGDVFGYAAKAFVMDEFSTWNKAITSTSEVSAIYNNGVPIDISQNAGSYTSSSDLNVWYRFGDANGDENLAVGNTLVTDASAPFVLTEKFSNADFATTGSVRISSTGLGWVTDDASNLGAIIVSNGLNLLGNSSNNNYSTVLAQDTNGSTDIITESDYTTYKITYNVHSKTSALSPHNVQYYWAGQWRQLEASQITVGDHTIYVQKRNTEHNGWHVNVAPDQKFKLRNTGANGTSITFGSVSLKKVSGKAMVVYNGSSSFSSDFSTEFN